MMSTGSLLNDQLAVPHRMASDSEALMGNISRRALSLMALAGIGAIASNLRLADIRFGLPYAHHIDEPT